MATQQAPWPLADYTLYSPVLCVNGVILLKEAPGCQVVVGRKSLRIPLLVCALSDGVVSFRRGPDPACVWYFGSHCGSSP